jgi:hypothetical protein
VFPVEPGGDCVLAAGKRAIFTRCGHSPIPVTKMHDRTSQRAVRCNGRTPDRPCDSSPRASSASRQAQRNRTIPGAGPRRLVVAARGHHTKRVPRIAVVTLRTPSHSPQWIEEVVVARSKTQFVQKQAYRLVKLAGESPDPVLRTRLGRSQKQGASKERKGK